jgi:hypothetical protein
MALARLKTAFGWIHPRTPHTPSLHNDPLKYKASRGPRLHLKLMNASSFCEGFLVFYFAQPQNSARPLSVSVRVGHAEDTVTDVYLFVPNDRINNRLYVEYYEYETQGHVLQRQAVGMNRFSHQWPMHDLVTTIPLKGVNETEEGDAGSFDKHCHRDVVFTVMGAEWDEDTGPKHGGDYDDIMAQWNSMEKFGQAPQPVHHQDVATYLVQLSQWLGERKQVEVKGLVPWDMVGENFESGQLPLWAFLTEYAHPELRTGTLESLSALVTTAAQMNGSWRPGQRVESLTLAQVQETLCDTMALLPLCLTYLEDQHRVLKPGAGAQTVQATDTFEPEDQWVHSLCFPVLKDAAYDCEDGAAVAYYVCRLLQTLPRQPLDTLLGAIQMEANLYTAFVAIGTLKLGSGEYTYHAYPLLMDTREVSKKLRQDLKTPPLETTSTKIARRPVLFIETTESTTACPNFTGGHQAGAFMLGRLADSRVHCKVPQELMHDSGQYETVIQLMCPQLYETCGLTDFFCTGRSGAQLGVSGQDLRNYSSGAWKAVVPVQTTHEVWDSVRLLNSQLPVTDGLPTIDEVVPHVPQWDPTQGEVLIFCKASLVEELQTAIHEHCKLTGKGYAAWHDNPVLNDLSLAYFVIQTTEHSIATPHTGALFGPYHTRDLSDRYRCRAEAMGQYPVRGLIEYHRTQMQCNVSGHHHEVSR